jgi:hypothetical protein
MPPARRGFVPISVAMYARVRQAIESDLRDRALVLIATDAAQVAEGSVRWCTPPRTAHARMSCSPSARGRSSAGVVREARAAYGARPLVRARLRRRCRGRCGCSSPRCAGGRVRAAGRHAAAERLLRDVAAALRRRGAMCAGAHVSLILGQLLLERGRAVAPITVFDDVSTIADRSVDPRVIWHARLWQASARIDQAQFTVREGYLSRRFSRIDTAQEVHESREVAGLAGVLLYGRARAEAART